jgi:hypothetical protein
MEPLPATRGEAVTLSTEAPALADLFDLTGPAAVVTGGATIRNLTRIPLRRIGQPGDIARMALVLDGGVLLS